MADNINTNNLNVSGNAVIGHDLTVHGNLVTDNVIGPDKGMFQSRYELVTSYPHPQDGWYAIVGTSLNGDVYTAKDGQWQATGEKGAVLELSDDQVNDLAQRLNKSNYDAAEHLGHFGTEAELMAALNSPGLWNGSAFHSILTYTVNKGDGSQKDGGVVLQSRGSGNQMTQYWFSDNGAIKVRTAANYTRYTYTPSVPCDIPWSAVTLNSFNALSDADKAKL